MLEKLLEQKKSAIVRRWLDEVIRTYPGDAERFLKQQKDSFNNPVGTTLKKELENLFQSFAQGSDAQNTRPILDRIIRIRAVQDFSPSEAVSFVFLLKKVTREALQNEIKTGGLDEDLEQLDSRTDDLILLAFDVYTACREKLYDIRVNEIKNQVSRLLQKKGLMVEIERMVRSVEEGNNSSV